MTDKPEALRLADEAARGTRVSEGQCLAPHAFKQAGGRLGPSLAKAMDTKQATRAGVQAYRDGIGCVPALNQRFLETACDTGRTLEMLEAYIHGWTIARLADGVTDLATPSVMELKKIEADD